MKVFVFLVCVLVFQLPHMTGSEKRGNFAQNANFLPLLNYHHTKAFREPLAFPLALQTL